MIQLSATTEEHAIMEPATVHLHSMAQVAVNTPVSYIAFSCNTMVCCRAGPVLSCLPHKWYIRLCILRGGRDRRSSFAKPLALNVKEQVQLRLATQN